MGLDVGNGRQIIYRGKKHNKIWVKKTKQLEKKSKRQAKLPAQWCRFLHLIYCQYRFTDLGP